LIRESKGILERQSALIDQNMELLKQVEVSKGEVVASTKDFQTTCISILNREQMLKAVLREIENTQQFYNDYEDCQNLLYHSQIMDDPENLIQLLHRVQDGIDFFKGNIDYKKAEVYIRRFESLKEKILEKVNFKILKVLKDTNIEINLALVKSEALEKAQSLKDLKPEVILYREPKGDTRSFFADLENSPKHMEYFDFLQKIYADYFEGRQYLIDLYLERVNQLIDPEAPLDQYLHSFLDPYAEIMRLEEEFFMKQFQKREKFYQFRADMEYDVLHKRIRPQIIRCVSFEDICSGIDTVITLKREKDSEVLLEESEAKIFEDMEERLTLMSHFVIEGLIEEINEFQATGAIKISEETLPLPFFEKLRDLLLDL